MFNGYYKLSRLQFLNKELFRNDFVIYQGESKFRKTCSFYGKNINWYIDTSDGMNEDLKRNEYCGRTMKIIEECAGKPFIIFKTSYSPILTADIKKIAEENNGIVLPFFIMSYYPEFYDLFLNMKEGLISKNKNTAKTIDIGFYANLDLYNCPKPQRLDNRISWRDYKIFGVGIKEFTENYIIDTRRRLFEKLNDSRFTFAHSDKKRYIDYLNDSCNWKVAINPPGCGEYTPRILEHAAMGQCVVIRKISYDNAVSWKEYIPQIDFDTENWESNLAEIVDNYQYWAERCFEYYNKFYQPQKMVDYLKNKIIEYESVCN